MKSWKRTRKGANQGEYMILDRETGEVVGDIGRVADRWWSTHTAGGWWDFAESFTEGADAVHARWLKSRAN